VATVAAKPSVHRRPLLSEAVCRDYHQILSQDRDELLNRYGIQVVVMNTMDYVSERCIPALTSRIHQHRMDLVYEDTQAVIFPRHSPSTQ
jgi:hypothetical protein